MTFKLDAAKLDGVKGFLENQLTAVDTTLNKPLVDASDWVKNIHTRSNISMGDVATAFYRTSYAANNGAAGDNDGWLSDTADGTIPTVSVGNEMVSAPVRPWGRALRYSYWELERAQKLGISLDAAQMEALNLSYQLNMNKTVHIGIPKFKVAGLLNSDQVAVTNAAAGAASGSPTKWGQKAAAEILADVNKAIQTIWEGNGYASIPDTLLLPPEAYTHVATTPYSEAYPQETILDWIVKKTLAFNLTGRDLAVRPCRFLKGLGSANKDRMVLYSNDAAKVRIASLPLFRLPVQLHDITYSAPVLAAVGEVEFVYPATLLYVDGV